MQRYYELKQLIETRRKDEEDRPYPPYTTYPTTLNFRDIHGKTLLHYACELGLFEDVKELLAKGADINVGRFPKFIYADPKPPILSALKAGHIEIAEYLYTLNKDVLNHLLDHPIKNIKGQNFVDRIAKEVLLKEGKENKEDKEDKSSPKSSLDFLSAAIVVGDLKYFQEHEKENGEAYLKTDGMTLLKRAVMHGKIDIVDFLLKHFPVDPELPYHTTLLEHAIKYDQIEMMKFLLKKGASPARQNQFKHNAVMVAVFYNKEKALNELLIDSKMINFKMTDIEDNNILHLCIQHGSANILKILLAYPDATKYLESKNIYGQSALDLAKEKNGPAILALLSLPYESLDVSGDSPKKTQAIAINQHGIVKLIHYYLQVNYRDTRFFTRKGKCNSFSYFHNYYASRGEEDFFYQSLQLLASWDGQPKSLSEPFSTQLPKIPCYKNFVELYEQWANDLIWFQHGPELKANKISFFEQHERDKQYLVIGDLNTLKRLPVCITSFADETFSVQQIDELLSLFCHLPPASQLELGGSHHSTSGFVDPQKQIHYYDPNFKYRTTVTDNPDQLLKRVIDFKYIFTKAYTSEKNVGLELYFYLPENYENISHPTFIKVPQNKEDAESIRNKSPNGFTSIHTAIIIRDTNALKKLLKDCRYDDINAFDLHGNTAFDLAYKNNYTAGIELLMQQPELNIPFQSLFKSHNLDIYNLNVTSEPLIDYLNIAISSNKKDLLDLFLRRIKYMNIPLNQIDADNKTPLSSALKEPENANLIKRLLELGASWTFSPTNEFGSRVSSALEDCLNSGNQEYIRLLLDTLEDIQIPNDRGETPLSLTKFMQEGALECVKTIVTHPKFDPEKDKTALHLLVHFSLEKNIPGLLDLLLPYTNPEIINQAMGDVPPILFESALTFKSISATKKLLDCGADVNVISKRTGNTCLHVLVLRFNNYGEDYLKLFLDHGASLDIKNNNNKTPYDLAKEPNNPKIIQIFDEYQAKLATGPIKLKS